MANDSDIDSWDLRQADLPSHAYYHNDSRSTTIRGFVTDEFQAQGTRTDLSSSDYSHFRPRAHITRSGSDLRFVNPAVYAVSVDANEDSAPRSIIRGNCGDSGTLIDQFSSLTINDGSNVVDHVGDEHTGRMTYRCQPLASPPTPSTLLSSRANSKSSVQVRYCTIGKANAIEQKVDDLSEQPEVQRYALNGTRVVEFSGTSSSNVSDRGGSTSRFIQAKRRAYEEWVEKKRAEELHRKEETRRIEQEKQNEEARIAKERDERDQRERENFLQWSVRKKKEEANKREAMEKELEFERRLKEVEGKAVVAKTIYLRQWARKKQEQQKALQKKQEVRKKRDDEERKKRLEESEKAYEKWRETSKNRPRPATQGLLPHQKATPSYINPNPWVADNDESG